MVFSSIPFLFFFLPIFLIIYYLLPYKNISLLIFSLIFYAWGEPVYILLMVFSSIFDFTIGKKLDKEIKSIEQLSTIKKSKKNKKNKNISVINKKNKEKIKKHELNMKKILFISICVNLLMLGFFKYADFLITNLNMLPFINLNKLNLGLPIGISFFTFQTMSYSIDVYRKRVNASNNFLSFMTYVCMFPQLIAGPIVRYSDVDVEIETRTINYQNFNNGLKRFLQGMFKKVLLANNVGYLFSLITVLPSNEISVLTAWLAIVCFALQIYLDFSGYSDMAIGIGKMLGFNYPENFNYPFVANSITDFWRRWHMTLSGWFKDYVYIPLGGNKTNAIRNIFIVWTLTGLWHGASWNFIIWGIYFAVLLYLEKYILKEKIEKLPLILKHITTIFLILISFYIFAFDDLNTLINFGQNMFGIANNKFIDNTFMFYLNSYFIILIVSILISCGLYKKITERVVENGFFTIGYIILFIISISFLVADTYNPFLYFRF